MGHERSRACDADLAHQDTCGSAAWCCSVVDHWFRNGTRQDVTVFVRPSGGGRRSRRKILSKAMSGSKQDTPALRITAFSSPLSVLSCKRPCGMAIHHLFVNYSTRTSLRVRPICCLEPAASECVGPVDFGRCPRPLVIGDARTRYGGGRRRGGVLRRLATSGADPRRGGEEKGARTLHGAGDFRRDACVLTPLFLSRRYSPIRPHARLIKSTTLVLRVFLRAGLCLFACSPCHCGQCAMCAFDTALSSKTGTRCKPEVPIYVHFSSGSTESDSRRADSCLCCLDRMHDLSNRRTSRWRTLPRCSC